VPWLIFAAVVATIVVGLVARQSGTDWGAPLQPLLITFDPLVTGWLAVSVAGLAAGLWAGLRLHSGSPSALGFGLAVFGLALFTRLALNVARMGPEEWHHVFIVRPLSSGRLEYLAAMTELRMGVGPFLDRFAEMVPTLPLHVAGHPPGLVLMLDIFGLETPQSMAALTIVVGAALSPVLYLLGRGLYDEGTARLAALLSVFVPTMLLYGATSADSLFATVALLPVLGLLSHRRSAVVAGAFGLAIASFFSYALLIAGGWAGLVRWRRDGTKSMIGVAMLCALALLVFYGLFFLLAGFDVVSAIEATHDRYYKGIASERPYLFWFFGSTAAFLFMLGPVAWYASRSLGSREITAVALAAAILITVVFGYTKAETERIWMFLVPMACLAAARALPENRVRPVIVALAVQAAVLQVLFDTVW
jgi:hypothetical protein